MKTRSVSRFINLFLHKCKTLLEAEAFRERSVPSTPLEACRFTDPVATVVEKAPLCKGSCHEVTEGLLACRVTDYPPKSIKYFK